MPRNSRKLKNVTRAAIGRMSPGDYLADPALPGLRVVAYDRRKAFA